MEDAFALGNYLPLSFKTRSEEDYLRFLWEAFESNYRNEKYQFAFLAYHMLTMSFIYFNVWQIRQALPQDFEKAMVGFNKDVEKELMTATSPFTFWRVNESNVMRFLKLIGCDNGKVGSYAALVKLRNDAAHSNGNIYFSTEAALDAKIAEVMRVADEIQSHSKPIIETCYARFLKDSADVDTREYPDAIDQVREVLVHGNYMSQADIDICMAFDIAIYETEQNFSEVQALHGCLQANYGNA
jgi:hypothetical protein